MRPLAFADVGVRALAPGGPAPRRPAPVASWPVRVAVAGFVTLAAAVGGLPGRGRLGDHRRGVGGRGGDPGGGAHRRRGARASAPRSSERRWREPWRPGPRRGRPRPAPPWRRWAPEPLGGRWQPRWVPASLGARWQPRWVPASLGARW